MCFWQWVGTKLAARSSHSDWMIIIKLNVRHKTCMRQFSLSSLDNELLDATGNLMLFKENNIKYNIMMKVNGSTSTTLKVTEDDRERVPTLGPLQCDIEKKHKFERSMLVQYLP